MAVCRQFSLVRSPTKLRRLHELAQKTVDRPRINEFTGLLESPAVLSIALGKLHDTNPQRLHKLRPTKSIGRDASCRGTISYIACNVEERLLHKM